MVGLWLWLMFRLRLRLRLQLRRRKQRQLNRERRPLALQTLTGDLATMQLHTPLYYQQSQPGARNLAGISSAMERSEELFLIGGGNADAVVAHAENSLTVPSFDHELD